MFQSDDFPMSDEGKNVEEKDHADIIRNLLSYIHGIKKDSSNKHISLIDIIVDFSFKTNIDVQTIGDIISQDEYFKSFIEKDCQVRNIVKKENDIQEW